MGLYGSFKLESASIVRERGMSVEVERIILQVGRRKRNALVLTPTDHVRIGRARLEALRSARESVPSSYDRSILEAVREEASGDFVLFFRAARDDGRGSYALADDLDDDEAVELASYLVRAQLSTYRKLAKLGVIAFIHVEFSPRDVQAYRTGTDRLAAELERAAPDAPDAGHELDLWLLNHLTFYFTISFDRAITSLIPNEVALLETRIPRLRELLDRLEPATERPEP